MATINLGGLWESCYQYESAGQQHESTHLVNVTYYDGIVAAVNQPEDVSDSVLSITLTRDDSELRGFWEERTEKHGQFGGQVMKGLLHLALNEAGDVATGIWTGMSRSGIIKSGSWVLRRVIPEAPTEQTD